MKGHLSVMVAVTLLLGCLGLPQIPRYDVIKVNTEVFDEHSDTETSQDRQYIELSTVTSPTASTVAEKEEIISNAPETERHSRDSESQSKSSRPESLTTDTESETKASVEKTILGSKCKVKSESEAYEVKTVNAEVIEEVGNADTSSQGVQYIEVQEKVVEDGVSPTRIAGKISLEVLDEVKDILGSKGYAVNRLKTLLKNAQG